MLGNISVIDFIVVLGSLLVSLGIHEAVHAFTAFRLGDDTAAEEGRLTINPLRHIDIYTTVLLPAVMMLFGLPPIFVAKPVPFNPERVRFGEFGAALVAIAGPFSNLGLAIIAALAVHMGIIGMSFISVAATFMWVNIGLFVFNMLPIPPLDGSRLLYAFAPPSVQRVMERIESVGILVVLLVILTLSSIIGPIISTLTRAIAHFLLPSVF